MCSLREIRSFFGLYFPAFGLNAERYSVYLHVQSECGKIRTRKSSVFGHFSRSASSLKQLAKVFSSKGFSQHLPILLKVLKDQMRSEREKHVKFFSLLLLFFVKMRHQQHYFPQIIINCARKFPFSQIIFANDFQILFLRKIPVRSIFSFRPYFQILFFFNVNYEVFTVEHNKHSLKIWSTKIK